MYQFRGAYETGSDVLAVEVSPDEVYCTAACSNGVVKVFSTRTSAKEDYSLDVMRMSAVKLPVTCLRFRPQAGMSKTKNMLVLGTAAGTIEHWHLTSRRCVSSIQTETEIYCLDYRDDGTRFAASGKDGLVRVYDEEGKKLAATLAWAEATDDRDLPANAHSSRVQSLQWIPRSPYLFVTGGWDKTLQVWDTRVDHAVSSMYGPYLCGDSLAVTRDGMHVITASCRDTDQLEIWSLASPRSPCQAIPLPPSATHTHFYSLSLSPNGILAAGGATDLLVTDEVSPNVTPTSLLWEDAHPIFSVHVSQSSSLLAVGGAGGRVRLYESTHDSRR
eukprot:TRINITY_DN27818_c0_g1_i1.p1 TRINITY_DN27818_c0_g1~~TRINITY_DN27818_c0_g1_i1.p1  ORF type:complete len:348 (+),score=46.90 TRINITY_DN27818_c0_g1_i1:54-1046(+)